jgi:hypothetical protein
LLLVQGLGLLLKADRQGARGQTNRCGAGDLLHGVEVDVEAGAVGAEGVFGDDFAPASGEGVDLLQHLGGELASRHSLSCLVLVESVGEEILQPL